MAKGRRGNGEGRLQASKGTYEVKITVEDGSEKRFMGRRARKYRKS